MSAKILLPNQHTILHLFPGDCCLCRAEQEIAELKREIEELKRKLSERDAGDNG